MSLTNEIIPNIADSRELPASITVPGIRGEMVTLRPVTLEDLPRMDELDAYYKASGITGKDEAAERAVVHAWVHRSVAWEQGQTPAQSGVGDPEARRTMAWAMLTKADHDGNDESDDEAAENMIGMIFLIDIDGWGKSARIQIVLGRDYRGRGYSRDAMPRVLTYGFAPQPAGLGLHRIWVAVPEKNTRSRSVYRSLGFVPEGTSRDALWDDENNKYMDQIVMGTLADEYDPVASLDAFGLHLITDNPGVREALVAREHSLAIQQGIIDALSDGGRTESGFAAAAVTASGDAAGRSPERSVGVSSGAVADGKDPKAHHRSSMPDDNDDGRPQSWAYGSDGKSKASKQAWWRNLGRSRKRESEEQ